MTSKGKKAKQTEALIKKNTNVMGIGGKTKQLHMKLELCIHFCFENDGKLELLSILLYLLIFLTWFLLWL